MDPVTATAAHGGGHHFAPPAPFHPFHFPAGPFQHFPGQHQPLMPAGGVQAKQEHHEDSSNPVNSTGSNGNASGEADQQHAAAGGAQAGAQQQQQPAAGEQAGEQQPPPVVMRRPRGRPAGSKNKPKPPLIITRDSASALRAHVLEVAAGCDVVDSVARFARRRQVGICILSGTGAVSNVSILQQAGGGAVVNLAGRFEILSLSGSFLPPPAPPSATGLTVYLSGGQGQVVGGAVAGELMASTSVVIVAACFGNASYERLPVNDDEPHPQQPALQQGLAGAGPSSSSPPPSLPLSAHPHQQLPLGDHHLPQHLLNGLQLPGDAAYGGWTGPGGSASGRMVPY